MDWHSFTETDPQMALEASFSMFMWMVKHSHVFFLLILN